MVWLLLGQMQYVAYAPAGEVERIALHFDAPPFGGSQKQG